ncbi:MAG: hypothetical protein R3F07_10615 [Opitutaceae bacterium]
MISRLKVATTAMAVLCLILGCRSGKVIREDFANLQRVEIAEAGISFLFPPDHSKLALQLPNGMSAYLNPVDEYPELGQDARAMMKIYFKRDSVPPFDLSELDRLTGGHGPDAPWAVFRRVIQCDPSEYWHLEIDVGRYSIDGHEYFEEDIEIAKRILESVECLP